MSRFHCSSCATSRDLLSSNRYSVQSGREHIRLTRTIGISLTGLVAVTSPAAAITICYPREQMITYMSRHYDAKKQAAGILRPYSVMEVWVSQGDRDWFIVTTDLQGSSCIVAYGEDFNLSDPQPPVEKG